MSALPYQVSNIVWQGREITIRHCPKWLHCDEPPVQHLELISTDKAPLPVTATGYKSHFITGENPFADFDNDPNAFCMAWLDDEAQKPDWIAAEKCRQEAEQEARQMSLF